MLPTLLREYKVINIKFNYFGIRNCNNSKKEKNLAIRDWKNKQQKKAEILFRKSAIKLIAQCTAHGRGSVLPLPQGRFWAANPKAPNGNSSTLKCGTTSIQFSSVAHSCPTLCNPMNRSTPGLPVHHQLPESTQTHVHWVGHAIQPSHPLSSPSPPAPNPSYH